MKKNLFIIIVILIIFYSCKKENTEKPSATQFSTKGFFILNEGNYTWSNSSLSFYDEQNRTIENDIFYKINNVTLGDVAQDIKLINNKLYVTINNSGIIYVLNATTCKHIKTIQNLTSPRYILPINDSIAYISDLYDKNITIINTITDNIVGKIFIGNSTESMIKYNQQVFCTSWSFNNKIYVLNSQNHQLIDSITVGLQPKKLQIDKFGQIWVLCDGGYYGNPIGHEKSSLWKINPQSLSSEKIIECPDKNFSATCFTLNPTGDSIYLVWKNVYKFSIFDTIFPAQPFIYSTNSSTFYNIVHHPYLPHIIICDAKNYVVPGQINIYSTQGQFIDSKQVGIIPNTICFNY